MPTQHFTAESFTIETAIQRVGRANLPSPLASAHLDDEDFVPIYLDSEHLEDLIDMPPVSLDFEPVGPRRKLYFDPSKTKCAIVTCGGLCPGINDVIRAIVMEAHHKYHVPGVLGIRYGLEGFIPKYGHQIIELTPSNVSEIYQFGGTILGSSRGPQDPAEVVDALERLNISILFVIGGDGSMRAMSSIVNEINNRNLRISVIGIPKTIDNDISFISQSFGFETAVFKATEAILCAHTEALGYKNGVGLVKLMGRDSGFIAAHATLALKEVNFVLVPEVPFALDGEHGLLNQLAQRLVSRKHAVIVVAEGAGQHLMPRDNHTDASGNAILGDVAELLKKSIKEYMGSHDIPYSLKYIDPSYIIRSVPANANDRVYCGFLGQGAVHAAMCGRTNMLVAKLMDRYVHLPLELVIRKRKKINTHSEYWRTVLESTGQPELTLVGQGK